MAPRVVFTRDLSRYPHFIVRAGMTGTVVYAEPDMIAVRMDETLRGAEEWDNEVCLYPSDDDGESVVAAAVSAFAFIPREG